MTFPRIIARLDIKGPNLVKGIHLEGLRVLGNPDKFAHYYYEGGADELLYMDVVASLYDRNSLHDIISKLATDVFIPLTVGGGIRTLDDIRTILRAGADKVSINTAALKDPEFISKAANEFGSSTIVVAIETIKQPDGQHLCYTDNGREHTGVEALAWAKQVEELGAGEVILTSVDHEGTGQGFDLDITSRITEALGIPVIAHGGAGRVEHIETLFNETQADAVALAGMLHYSAAKKITFEESSEGNIDFLKSGAGRKNLEPAEITDVKHYLSSKSIECRL